MRSPRNSDLVWIYTALIAGLLLMGAALWPAFAQEARLRPCIDVMADTAKADDIAIALRRQARLEIVESKDDRGDLFNQAANLLSVQAALIAAFVPNCKRGAP